MNRLGNCLEGYRAHIHAMAFLPPRTNLAAPRAVHSRLAPRAVLTCVLVAIANSYVAPAADNHIGILICGSGAKSALTDWIALKRQRVVLQSIITFNRSTRKLTSRSADSGAASRNDIDVFMARCLASFLGVEFNGAISVHQQVNKGINHCVGLYLH